MIEPRRETVILLIAATAPQTIERPTDHFPSLLTFDFPVVVQSGFSLYIISLLLLRMEDRLRAECGRSGVLQLVHAEQNSTTHNFFLMEIHYVLFSRRKFVDSIWQKSSSRKSESFSAAAGKSMDENE